MNIVEASMKNRQITLLITLLLVVVGVYSLMHMARREDPKMTIRQGLIIMTYPGAKAIRVEKQVTKRIEEHLFRYEEVKKDETESRTSDGLSIIQVELQGWVKNRDKFWSKLRHDLYELKAASLPRETIGPVINSDFGDTIALLIAVESDRHTYTDLKDYIEIIEDELRPLLVVSKLKRYGEQKEQLYVTSNSQKLSKYGVSIQQVIEALQSMNTVNYAGEIKSGSSEIQIHTSDLYDSVDQILEQQVYITPKGEIVRVKDVAEVERRYMEPDSFIRVNGTKVLMLSVEMQSGYNIVEFGQKVDERLDLAKKRLPSDVRVRKVVDQPSVVDHSIMHFLKEFLIAIVAVILVMMVLLPLRVALVSALAIPITIMITFAFLDFLKIDLQQMTLAGLIVVLGMVVDNAIVIVDDYIERLDQGAPPWDAGWQSATDLFVPVFSATIAIICAFIPMDLILSGNAGEFLFTLPVAVAVALVVSLFVAILLTPLLCYLLIKTGLHSAAKKKTKPSALDRLQAFYDAVLLKAFNRPGITLLVGFMTIVATVVLMSRLPIRMFSIVERNQFCLEIYMNQGINLETTDRAVKKIERLLGKDERVTEVASFVGCASPRFYMTYAPQMPDKNYAQVLINTASNQATQELVDELLIKLNDFLPDGQILVKQLQQGPPVDAPIEVRVVGNDLVAIKKIGNQIKEILKNTAGTNFVRTTFREDYYDIGVKVDENVANRLGFSSQSIAQLLALSFKGAAVSTLWEGDNPIDIFLRFDKESRTDFDAIGNAYVTSPATGAAVPLRQIAKLVPEWQTGKIRRRNGVRTLTVRSEAQMGRMPNEILNKIMPQIHAIDLPLGISINYGGELEDEKETMGEFAAALGTSLILIFMVLLFQFKELKKTVIIMITIPLSWFGAIFGLYITNNPFCFTGFIGVISLSGLVVRNGIILIDYADKLLAVRKEEDVRSVALDAGKRRMRPVFLTSIAAAAGVVPMIIGGSPLWAPLGSVLSVGLIFGMILTLFIVPVLYWLVMKSKRNHATQKSIHHSNIVKVKV
ncbi:efflux RND transporter permease subunit [Desulfosarcina sp.]|uniref:efflux RND transporter permease subunit n=1 Tax=Desulfosarcina sp. TaxID=2027861 RepID=UPI0029A3D8FB|nr:efflux RND transporter permease subunit [Desulfosarcina sp.]MDX2453156.1 efflux RND transporter permease subunit [Desulfosarcina sp.]MDX2490885.1 efflux RND transporter permease subunit [Desulfosarcina sp.]